jgi:cell division transport system permease protein
MLSFFRIIKFALQDVGRNISLSFMTVLILVLMLLSINTLVIVKALTEEAVISVKEQIDVSVYFQHDASDKDIEEIRTYVDSFPEVTEVTYVETEEVLAQFRDTHKDSPDILASLDELGENPLGPTMVIKTREPGEYGNIITALGIPEYEHIIEAKTFADTEKAIAKIDVITQQVEKSVLILSALFIIIAFFVIFNTIRVAIYTQRVEIGIKKLVGATNWFVRGPYVIESILFSIFSVLITGVIIWFTIQFLDSYVAVILNKQQFLTNYFESNILVLVGSQFLAVLLLTVVTSGLAMRKYLRV